MPRSGLLVANAAEASSGAGAGAERGPVERFNAADAWRAEGDDASRLCLFSGAAAIGETAWALTGDQQPRQRGCALLMARRRVPLAQKLAGAVALCQRQRRMEAVVPPAASLVLTISPTTRPRLRRRFAGLRRRVGAARIWRCSEPRSNTDEAQGDDEAQLPVSADADAVYRYGEHLAGMPRRHGLPLGEGLCRKQPAGAGRAGGAVSPARRSMCW